jgi:hypothetical protein
LPCHHRNALNVRGGAPVLEDMTIARRGSTLATLAALAAILAGCASDAPVPSGAPVVSAAPRPTSALDPSAAADAATYAAWRRAPVTPTPAFRSAVEAACRGDEAVGSMPLAVLDARGQGRAILVFSGAAGTAAVVCVADDDQAGSVTVKTHEVPGSAKAPVPEAGKMGVHDLFAIADGASSYSAVVGRYGPDGVKDVAANFDADAAWYTAASDNGWYALWWPGQAKPRGVATSSRRTEVIDSYAP